MSLLKQMSTRTSHGILNLCVTMTYKCLSYIYMQCIPFVLRCFNDITFILRCCLNDFYFAIAVKCLDYIHFSAVFRWPSHCSEMFGVHSIFSAVFRWPSHCLRCLEYTLFILQYLDDFYFALDMVELHSLYSAVFGWPLLCCEISGSHSEMLGGDTLCPEMFGCV